MNSLKVEDRSSSPARTRRLLLLVAVTALSISTALPASSLTDNLFPQRRLAFGDLPEELVSRDFDQDGRPDLIIVNSASDDLTWLAGAGDGSFVAHQAMPVGRRPDLRDRGRLR